MSGLTGTKVNNKKQCDSNSNQRKSEGGLRVLTLSVREPGRGRQNIHSPATQCADGQQVSVSQSPHGVIAHTPSSHPPRQLQRGTFQKCWKQEKPMGVTMQTPERVGQAGITAHACIHVCMYVERTD